MLPCVVLMCLFRGAIIKMRKVYRHTVLPSIIYFFSGRFSPDGAKAPYAST
nr:MAG TPA: hypothetical protein [Caudoviricetes sp.]